MRLTHFVFFALVAAVLVGSGMFQREVAMGERRLIRVGDHRLLAVTKGTGLPVVVFESGFGSDLRTWEYVYASVAEFTTAVAYSRAGNGDSEIGPQPRSTATVARELQRLLRGLGLDPPFVLVGHSLGGLYVREFAAQYPSEVQGLVLVDAAHERMFQEFERLDPEFRKVIERQREQVMSDMPSLLSEFDEYVRLQDTEAPSVGPLPDVPIAVLTSVKPYGPDWVRNTPAGLRVWRELQAEWARSSSDSTHIVTSRSGHFIQRSEPSLVIGAIRRIVDLHRAGETR